MRIMIDGHKVSTNIRTSKELLLMLKDLSRTFQWKTRYNPSEEIVHIMTQDMPELTTLPILITEPTSQRLDGKIICIDAGHGGNDTGSCGPNGTYEKEHTLAIALSLREILEQNGAAVVMTRSDDTLPIWADAPDDKIARAAIAGDASADLLLSLHADGFYPRPISRSTVYYYRDESETLAKCLARSLGSELLTPASSYRFGSFSVIRYASMTAVWVDIASLANPEEELFLSSKDGRDKIASALYHGITQFFHV
ncbi:MAG: N-acetylmuramoyl-L-alanine amidase [Selenomonadales bacterium]|nr:N-acetylmuramoyl-L-alanine amidase [Selenomonadales bacterium]